MFFRMKEKLDIGLLEKVVCNFLFYYDVLCLRYECLFNGIWE